MVAVVELLWLNVVDAAQGSYTEMVAREGDLSPPALAA
jgi:hypothetical protein